MKLKQTKVATLAATLITLGSLAGGANAAISFTEEFNYTEGASLGAQAPWSQFGPGGTVSIQNGRAVNGPSANTGLRAVVTGAAPDAVYFSVGLSLDRVSGSVPGFVNLALGNAGGGSNGGGPNIEIGLSDGFFGAGSNIYGRVVNRQNTSLSSIGLSPYNLGDEITLVARAVDNGGANTTLTIWNNPTSESDPPIIEFTQFAQIVYNSVRVGYFNGNSDLNQSMDNIRVASTFSEVAPVPEPSSALLLGFASLSLVARRRRSN